MIKVAPEVDRFKQQLRISLSRKDKTSRRVTIAKHSNVYTCGDRGRYVYFIESGQIKLLKLSRSGKECLLSIYTAGDLFGELCLSGYGTFQETANAMEESRLIQIPDHEFFKRLSDESLFEGFVKYLALRISERQEVITSLATVDCERRLGKILLQLAEKVNGRNPRGVRIENRITHRELSEMVGTTRSRVSEFMRRFRQRDLIKMSSDRYIIVNERELNAYVNQYD